MAEFSCGCKIWRHCIFCVLLLAFHHTSSAYKDDGLLEASLRLSAGTSARVEFMHNGVWAPVCRDGFGLLEALVVCSQMGFTNGMAVVSGRRYTMSGSFSLSCHGSEPLSALCNKTWLPQGCASETVAHVHCTGSAALQRPAVLGGSHRRARFRGLSVLASGSGPSPRPRPSPPPQRKEPLRSAPAPKPPARAPFPQPPPPKLRPPPPKLRPPPPKPPQARPHEAPPPVQPTTCQVTLAGPPSADTPSGGGPQVVTADVSCVPGDLGEGSRVNVTVGSRLLAFSGSWTGVVVSQRPADDEWGITFNDVPHIQLRDSVVQNLPLSRGPLLQFSNCSQVVFSTVSVLDIRPGAVPRSRTCYSNSSMARVLHGPVMVENVTAVFLHNFNCSGVRGSCGWACIMLQYNPYTRAPTPRLEMTDSSFVENRVAWDGLYGTVGVARLEGGNPPECIAGHGMVVIAPAPLSSSGEQQQPSHLEVALRGVVAHSNRGGVGAFLSSLNPGTTSFTISRSNFSGNEAIGDGGVFNIMGPVHNFIVADATQFTSNNAGANGGALCFAQGVSLLRVSGRSSLLTNGAVDGYGGAVWSGGRVGAIEIVEDSLMNGNFAIFGGGAAVRELGELTVAGSSAVVVNSARCDGGALWISPETEAAPSISVQDGSNITYNEAGGQGGAVWAGGGLDRLVVLGRSSVIGNAAAGSGGAVAVPSGNIRSVLLADNSAMGVNSAGARRPLWNHDATGTVEARCGSDPQPGAPSTGSGGAVAVNGSIGSLELGNSSRVYNNSAAGDGGAFWVAGTVDSVALRSGSIASYNRADGSGGVLFAVQLAVKAAPGAFFSRVMVGDGSRLVGNSAGEHGGALAMQRLPSQVRIEGGSEVADNVAAGGDGGAFCLRADGPPSNIDITIASSLVHGNRAGSSGGGLYLGRSSQADEAAGATPTPPILSNGMGKEDVSTWQLDISSSQLSYNSAVGAGGAIFAAATSDVTLRVTVSSSMLSDNTAGDGSSSPGSLTANGGALSLYGALGEGQTWAPAPLPDIDSECRLIPGGDQAKAAAQAAGSCLLELRGAFFQQCSSAGSGGAVSLEFCTAMIENSTFIDNASGQSGGALSVEAPRAVDIVDAPYPGMATWHAIVVRSSVFAGNKAWAASGGAVAASSGGLVRMCGCNLTENSAGQDGGAVAAFGSGTDSGGGGGAAAANGLLLFACSIGGNRAGAFGGGVSARSLAVFAVQQSSLSGNVAGDSGGALAVVAPPEAQNAGAVAGVTLSDSVLYRNSVTKYGGGLYLTGQYSVSVTRMQLVSNAAGLDGGAIAASRSGSGDGAGPLPLEDCYLVDNVASSDEGSDFYWMLAKPPDDGDASEITKSDHGSKESGSSTSTLGRRSLHSSRP